MAQSKSRARMAQGKSHTCMAQSESHTRMAQSKGFVQPSLGEACYNAWNDVLIK